MIKSMKKMFYCILVACLFTSVTSMIVYAEGGNIKAEGDNCKKVHIKITNHKIQEIKVTRVEYKDFDSNIWRMERSWIPLKIAPGITRTRKRNLEHVKYDPTIIQIYYRINLGGSSWSKKLHTVQSDKVICRPYRRIKLHVRDNM